MIFLYGTSTGGLRYILYSSGLGRLSEPERVVFGSLEQEPLEKKSGAGARAAKILAGSSALLEDAYGNCTFVNLQIVSFYG